MLTKLRATWRSAGWIRYLICVPLWLALWNAPLPWVHRHDMTQGHADEELAWHLRAFHHGSDAPHDSESWHWHFAFLWQMMDCDQMPAGEQNSHSILMTGENCPCLSASDVSPRELVERFLSKGTILADVQPNSDLRRTPASLAAGHSRQFLQTFLSGAALRDLLSVARC